MAQINKLLMSCYLKCKRIYIYAQSIYIYIYIYKHDMILFNILSHKHLQQVINLVFFKSSIYIYNQWDLYIFSLKSWSIIKILCFHQSVLDFD